MNEEEHRIINVGDSGTGVDRQPSSVVLVEVPLYGGPLDGFISRAVEPKRDLEMLRILDEKGNPSTGEVYLAREVDARWVGVHIDLLQDYVRSDEVHLKDPGESISARMAAHPDVRWEFAIPICPEGEHRWSAWRRSPMGNKTRICVVCQTAQSNILGG